MQDTDWFISLLLVLLLVGLASVVWAKYRAEKRGEEPGKFLAFPGANVRLKWPSGFEVAQDFEGFGLPDTAVSIMATQLFGPFDQVAANFGDDSLRLQNMLILSKESVTIGELPGLLLRVSQTAQDITFDKWLLVFGDAQATHLITATCPQSQSANYFEVLKAVVLSARREKAPDSTAETPAEMGTEVLEQVPFTVDSGNRLKITRSPGKTLLLTRDGAIPAASPADPIFVVAPSLGAVAIADRNQFARNRLQQTEQTSGITITAQSPLRVDDMDGIEIVARANDATTGIPLLLYQAMLFDAQGYYLMQGMVSQEEQADYLPVFKTIARTFRRNVVR